MKIIITEEHFKKLILELKSGCPGINYKLSKVLYYGDDGIPPDYILKNPFNDGFDYQYKILDNCQREWIRRSIKNRNFDTQDLYRGADATIGKNKDQLFINSKTDEKLYDKLYQKIKSIADENKKLSAVSRDGGSVSLGFSNNIKNQSDGDKFRAFVHGHPQRLKNVNDHLIKKGIKGGFSKTGPWNNQTIKVAWESFCGTRNTDYGQVKLNMGDCFTATVKTKESMKSDTNSVLEFLKKLGFGKILEEPKVKNAKTGNEIYAYASLYAIYELTQLISRKTITGTKGQTAINVMNKEPGYYNAKNYSIEVAKYLNSQTVCSNPKKLTAPYVCYLSDFYFNFNKLIEHLDSVFLNDKYAVNTSLFPNGVYSFYVSYFGTDNYSRILNYVNSFDSTDVCNNIKTIDKYKKTTSLWDAEFWEIPSEDVLNVASFLVSFIPIVGPIVNATTQIYKASESFKKGDYVGGTFNVFAAALPFVSKTSIFNKINKNLPSEYVSVTRYIPPDKQNAIIKLGEKIVLSKTKDYVKDHEKQLVRNIIYNVGEVKDNAETNINKIITKYGKQQGSKILMDISNGKKTIFDYV